MAIMDEINTSYDTFNNVADAIKALPESARSPILLGSLQKLYNSLKTTITNYMPSLDVDEQVDAKQILDDAEDTMSYYTPSEVDNKPLIDKEGVTAEAPAEKKETGPKERNIDAEIGALNRRINHLKAQYKATRNSVREFDPSIYGVTDEDIAAYEQDPINYSEITGHIVRRKDLIDAVNAKRDNIAINESVDRNLVHIENDIRKLIDQKNELIAEQTGEKPQDEYSAENIAKIEDYLNTVRPNNYDYGLNKNGYVYLEDEAHSGMKRGRYDPNNKLIGYDTFWSMTENDNNNVLDRAYMMLMDYFTNKGQRKAFMNDPSKFTITPEMISEMSNDKVNTTTNPRLYYALLRYPEILRLNKLKAKIHNDADIATTELRRIDAEKGDKKSRLYYKYPEQYRRLLDAVDEALMRAKSILPTDEALEYDAKQKLIDRTKNEYMNRRAFDFGALKSNTDFAVNQMYKNNGTMPYEVLKDYLDAGRGTNAQDFPPPGNTKIKLIIHANDYDLEKDSVWCNVMIYDPNSEYEEKFSEIGKTPEFGWHDTEGWDNRAKDAVKDSNDRIINNLDKVAERQERVTDPKYSAVTSMGEPYKETPSSEYGSKGNLELGIEDPNAKETTTSTPEPESQDALNNVTPPSIRATPPKVRVVKAVRGDKKNVDKSKE